MPGGSPGLDVLMAFAYGSLALLMWFSVETKILKHK